MQVQNNRLSLENVFNIINENRYKEFTEILRTLISNRNSLDFNIDSVDSNGLNLIGHCCKTGQLQYAIDIIDMFGDLCRPDNFDKDGNTTLIYSTMFNDENLYMRLLNLDRTWLTINHINTFGVSALLYFIRNNRRSIFERIISDERFNINTTNDQGENILIMTAKLLLDNNLKKYYIMRLLDMGVNVNQKTLSNKTVLSFLYDTVFYADVIDRILEMQTSPCEVAIFKEFKTTDFLNINEVGFEKGTYGQVIPVIEKSSGKTKILKKYLLYKDNAFLNKDVIKEITYINIINEKHNCSIAVDLEGVLRKDGKVYLVLNPLDMTIKDYFKIIRDLPHSKIYIKNIIHKLIKSLYEIHCLGIVHNDLKCTNIMVNNGEVYIIDFGISSLMNISPIGSVMYNYLATKYIKAPDDCEENDDLIEYEYNEKIITIKRNQYSYHSDVFSIGVTLINLILDGYKSYIYLKDYDQIFRSEDGILVPLTDYEIVKINDCGDYMYELIEGMIDSNTNTRTTLLSLLDINLNKIEEFISIYIPLNKNDPFFKLLDKRRYTPGQIKNNRGNLQYLEQIHNNYIGTTININNDKDISKFVTIVVAWLIDVMSVSNNLIFDVICNCIISLKNTLHNFNKGKYQLHGISVLQFFLYVNSSDNLNLESYEYICDKIYNQNDIRKSFEDFSMTAPKYYSIDNFVQYIIIKMQCMNINGIIISQYEIYTVKMIIKYLLYFAEGEINIWDFILSVAFRFTENHTIDISMYFNKNSLVGIYNMNEIELSEFKSKDITF